MNFPSSLYTKTFFIQILLLIVLYYHANVNYIIKISYLQGKPTAYLCYNSTCSVPDRDLEILS